MTLGGTIALHIEDGRGMNREPMLVIEIAAVFALTWAMVGSYTLTGRVVSMRVSPSPGRSEESCCYGPL